MFDHVFVDFTESGKFRGYILYESHTAGDVYFFIRGFKKIEFKL